MARKKQQPLDDTTPDSELVKKIEKWLKGAAEANERYQKRAKKCYAFFNGRQWEDADKTHLQKQGRPCITMNRIAAFVNAIVGTEASHGAT